MDQRELSLILKLQDEASAELRKFAQNIEGAEKTTQGFGKTLEGLQPTFKKIALASGAAFAAVSGGVLKSVSDFSKFEEQIQKAGANVDATTEQLQMFRDAAKKVGLDTQFSATEAAEALFYLAGGSIDAAEAQFGLQEAVKMAASGELSLKDAVIAAGDAINSYGITTEDATKISDIFIYSTTRVQQTAEELTQAYKQVNSTARQAGLSIEETTGFLNLFADSGKRGMEGGIALSNILRNLTTDIVPEFSTSVKDNTKKQDALSKQIKTTENTLERLEVRMKSTSSKAAPALKVQIAQTKEKLAGLRSELDATPASLTKMGVEMSDKAKLLQELGIQVFDSSGKIRNMTEVIVELATKFQSMSDQQRLANAEIIFGARSARDWLTVIGQGPEVLQQYIADLNNVAGTAQAFAKRLDDARSPLEIFSSTMEYLSLTVGQQLTPVFRDLALAVQPIVETVGKWIEANPELTKNIVLATLAVTGLVFVLSSLAALILPIITLFGMLSPTVLIVIGILGALTYAIMNVVQIFTLLRDHGAEVWEGIKIIFKEAIDWIISKTLTPFMNWIDKVRNAIASLADAAGSIMKSVGGTIKTSVTTVAKKLSGKAEGGPVTGGVPYVVGEVGPELFVPSRSGTIIPNKSLGSGVSLTVNVYGDTTGNELVDKVSRAIADNLKRRMQFA